MGWLDIAIAIVLGFAALIGVHVLAIAMIAFYDPLNLGGDKNDH